MGLFERRSSHAGLEDVERTAAHDHDRQQQTSSDAGSRTRGHPHDDPTEHRHSGSSGTNAPTQPTTSSSSESSLSFANRMLASKHGLKLSGHRGEPHPSHHPLHFMPHSSNNSKASSAKTSSSSLQAMNEDSVSDARTEPSGGLPFRPSLARRLSSQLELSFNQSLTPTTHAINTSADFPVYPDQSYAVLQSQFYPPPYQPALRGRSSYPSHNEYLKQLDYSSYNPRTVGNTPVSSPGLFAGRTARTSPSVGSDDEPYAFSPYLHPTHLQPPKE
jgi:SNF1-activating kinase 1